MATSTQSPLPAEVPGDESKQGSLRALRTINFFIADGQNSMGPYMALFLQSGAG